MNLLRHISHCDMVPPSRVIGGAPALTEAGDLVLSGSIFRGWGLTFGFWASFLIRCTWNKDRKLIGWVCWWVASHDGAQISPSEHLGGDVIPPPSCVSWRFHPGWTSLSCMSCQSPSGTQGIVMASEGFIGILVILLEMREGWLFWFGLPWRRVPGEEIFHLKESLFLWKNLSEFLPGSLDWCEQWGRAFWWAFLGGRILRVRRCSWT